MKFRPETDNDRTEGIPSAPAGEHVMRISSWIEDRQTKNGTKDLVEFVGEIPYDGEIVMVGTTMWISHPEGGKKGNLWKYRQLAEALGIEPVNGRLALTPDDLLNQTVSVEVSHYTSKAGKVSATVKRYVPAAKPKAAAKPVAKKAAPPADEFPDDIPF